jgi:hypothetical protein
MFKKIQNWAVGVLIVSVVLMTFVAILSIWDVFAKDTFWKSISTIGVIAFSSLIVLIAAKSVEEYQNKHNSLPPMPPMNPPMQY